jgi:ParB/RepB/Spo0J family partition protein
MTEKTAAPELWEVDAVIEAPWNANVMPVEIFKQLLEDLRKVGPEGTDPVHIAEVTRLTGEVAIVTCDGAHRLRAAQKLGWKQLYVVFHHEITTEEQARLFNYKRDAERGEVDPFRLAETFKWFNDQGFNHNVIAERFGIDRSTVTKRLGLLKVDDKVKEAALDHGLTISHLEPLTALEPKLQRQVLNEAAQRSFNSSPSVKAIESSVKWVLEREEKVRKFQERIEKAKFPKCPTCKKPPEFSSYYGDNTFRCGNYHTWSPDTGKEPNEDRPKFNPRTGGYGASLPQHVKMEATPKDFEAASWSFIQKAWPDIGQVDNVELRGKLKNGIPFRLRYSGFGDFEYEAPGEKLDLAWADVGKTTPAYKKGLRTRVTLGGTITKKPQLEEWAKKAAQFLETYGGVPRGTKKAKK